VLLARGIRKEEDVQTNVITPGQPESEFKRPIAHSAEAGAIANTA
jgi:hypothetical protein